MDVLLDSLLPSDAESLLALLRASGETEVGTFRDEDTVGASF